MNCAKTAEPLEMPFGLWTRMGARWRNLANTIEPPVCGGDTALRQITLTTCCCCCCCCSVMLFGHGLRLCVVNKTEIDSERTRRSLVIITLSDSRGQPANKQTADTRLPSPVTRAADASRPLSVGRCAPRLNGRVVSPSNESKSRDCRVCRRRLLNL